VQHSRPRLIVALALLLAAPCVVSAEGIALNWSKCEADGGFSNMVFACNTNAGFLGLAPSFQLDAPLTGVKTVRGTLEVVSETPTLPAWWDLDVCRSGSITTLNTVLAPALCSYWATGLFVNNGIDSYVTGLGGPNTARCEFRSFVNVNSLGASLSAGQEYIVTALRINFNRTVGSPSCGGCGTGVCLELKNISLQLGNGPTFVNLTTPMPTPDGSHVTWQGGGSGPNGSCVGAVGTRRSAWGAIKSLYR
jgi:hypothetical protein